ncbi:MAG TPA: 5'/3'-nucleotidase SurE [Fimbriimonadaceae bacterium]|nr:5'/3'-nucleotidase SurE [Fimbriimonadaceae bacterium]HRJ33401.1 5'/3'-nucleotidase SurE [Fimbriimonadaceae bacterium]
MRILLTNDDGIRAPGLAALVSVACKKGEVWVVAPDRERSACGHAMTMRDPLRAKPVDELGVRAFELNGLPVDCVNYGRSILLEGQVDLVLSGINRGPNLGFDITYSGTAGGAMEGAINGIASFAISMALFVEEAPPHFETGADWLDSHWDEMLGWPRLECGFYNLNIPAVAESELRGVRFARMGRRVYEDRMELRSDPWGRPYAWQGGVAALNQADPGSDVEAIREQFVAVTPISLDWTDTAMLAELQNAARSRAS